MKNLLFLTLIIFQMNGESFEHKQSRSCVEVLEEIDILKQEKSNVIAIEFSHSVFKSPGVQEINQSPNSNLHMMPLK